MACDETDEKAIEPIPISQVGKRYRLHDINAASYLRKHHHICGVLLGSIPQIPQQNVFLGLPMELMAEEVRLLVDKGAAYIVDDRQWHTNNLKVISKAERSTFESHVRSHESLAAKTALAEAKARQEAAMKKLSNQRDSRRKDKSDNRTETDRGAGGLFAQDDGDSQSQSTIAQETTPNITPAESESWHFTPACSYPPLTVPAKTTLIQSIEAPQSYALFEYLHSKGYFLSPGLRFGCQYLAYPGDPLRFHSHFLAVSFGWDDEIDLLDLVAGGRLGTGVKKGFLVGGPSEKPAVSEFETTTEIDRPVRAFCIEWGGM